MEALYLIKLGEIHLKEGNRKDFIAALKFDLKRRLSGVPNTLTTRDGRYYLTIGEEHAAQAEFILSRTPGINGWARALKAEKNIEAMAITALEAMRPRVEAGIKSFKVESRRADKGFPLDSYAVSREIGGRILAAFPQLKVDVHTPETVLNVEVREKTYIYTDGEKGVRGLPVGSAGKGLLLLSGGIDSPVAGFMMASRGLALEAVHFTSYPYTSKEAWQKVRDLAGILSDFTGTITLHTVSFTEVQLAIKKDAPADCATLYLRAAMMIAAHALAEKRGLSCLVSGESLSQVASQTAENMRFTQSYTNYPVFRPLVGTDKEDTVKTARMMGSYEISILPFEDCCVLFSAKHPILKADFVKERKAFDSLGLVGLIQTALESVESLEIPFIFPKSP